MRNICTFLTGEVFSTNCCSAYSLSKAFIKLDITDLKALSKDENYSICS